MNQNFGGNGFGQQQNFQQPQQNQQQFQQPQQQNNFQQPQQFQQQGGGMFVDNNQGPSAGNGILPKGHYPVRITNAEYKENAKQTGWILAIENTVTAGAYAGRKIFDNYNMQHTSEITQNIGQANYAKLCQSIFGNPQNRPQNPAALIGAEYVVDYGLQKKKSANNTYQPEPDENEEPTMEVKDRLPITSYNAGAQQQPQQQVMSQQAFNQQPQQNQNQSQQQQFNQQAQPQQQFNQQQPPQQAFNQQQVQQPQQQGFQQQSGNVPDSSQAGTGNQQGATLQPAQNQGQNGNGQGNGAPQGDNSANANPGNVNQTPFNQGAGNGFGGGFGSM